MKFHLVPLGIYLTTVYSPFVSSALFECVSNDVLVSCARSCPKLCVDRLSVRKCKYVPCQKGCTCLPGMVRKLDITGMCIRRKDCKRWII